MDYVEKLSAPSGISVLPDSLSDNWRGGDCGPRDGEKRRQEFCTGRTGQEVHAEREGKPANRTRRDKLVWENYVTSMTTSISAGRG